MDRRRSTRNKSEPIESTSVDDSVKSEVQDASSNDYEAIRLENIRRNEEFLRDLGIANIKYAIEVSKPVIPAKAKRSIPGTKAKTILPPRRSTRVTVDRLKAEIAGASISGVAPELIEQKKNELQERILAASAYTYDASAQLESEKARFIEELLPWSTALVLDEDEDRGLHEFKLISSFSFPYRGMKTTPQSSTEYKPGNYSCVSVEKVTPARITCCTFHPSFEKIIVVAGDKYGNVGIWDTSSAESDVFLTTPHVRGISQLWFSPFETTQLWSASGDGTVRRLDIEQRSFVLGYKTPDDDDGRAYLTDTAFLGANGSTNGAYISDSLGRVTAIDMRVSNSVFSWQYQADSGKISSIQIHPLNENIIACAGGGRSSYGISFHDIRKAGSRSKSALLHTLNDHSQSVSGAYISPDGSSLVSVSGDNTMRLWSGDFTFSKGGNSVVSSETIRRNNHTGKWLSTFKPTFDYKQNRTFIVGSLDQPRRIETFDVVQLKADQFKFQRMSVLSGDLVNSVCSRNAIHRNCGYVAGGNSSGKVHLFESKGSSRELR